MGNLNRTSRHGSLHRRRPLVIAIIALAVLSSGCRAPGDVNVESSQATDSQGEPDSTSTTESTVSESEPESESGFDGISGQGRPHGLRPAALPPLFAGVATGVVEFDAFIEPGSLTSTEPPVDGSLTLTGCSWLGPDLWLFDFTWDGPAGTLPIVVGFSIQPTSADSIDGEGPQHGGWYGAATVSGPGQFVIRGRDAWTALSTRPDSGLWTTLFPPWPPSGTCNAELVTDDESTSRESTEVPVTIDQTEPEPTPAADTIDALLYGADPLDPESPMLALTGLHVYDNIPVDRFFLHPGKQLFQIVVQKRGGCIGSVSDYGPEGAITQFLNCGDDVERPEGFSVIEDDVWEVHVGGDADFAAGIQRYWYPQSVDPATAPDMLDAEEMADEGSETNGLVAYVELGRFDWQGDEVIVTGPVEQDYCCVIYEAETTDGLRGASTGSACRDWFTAIHSDDNRGFAVVVVHGNRTATIDLGTRIQAVTPVDSAIDGLKVAVVDLPLDFSEPQDHLSRITVFEQDGSPSPCVQD